MTTLPGACLVDQATTRLTRLLPEFLKLLSEDKTVTRHFVGLLDGGTRRHVGMRLPGCKPGNTKVIALTAPFPDLEPEEVPIDGAGAKLARNDTALRHKL